MTLVCRTRALRRIYRDDVELEIELLSLFL